MVGVVSGPITLYLGPMCISGHYRQVNRDYYSIIWDIIAGSYVYIFGPITLYCGPLCISGDYRQVNWGYYSIIF